MSTQNRGLLGPVLEINEHFSLLMYSRRPYNMFCANGMRKLSFYGVCGLIHVTRNTGKFPFQVRPDMKTGMAHCMSTQAMPNKMDIIQFHSSILHQKFNQGRRSVPNNFRISGRWEIEDVIPLAGRILRDGLVHSGHGGPIDQDYVERVVRVQVCYQKTRVALY